MSDKKEINTENSEIEQINSESEQAKPEPEQVKPEIEQIKPEFSFEKSSADVNENLGVFANNTKAGAREIADEVVEEKKQDPKIDFEKFTRTKTKNEPTSSFGLKVDHWLRTPQTLKKIWIIIYSSLLAFLIITITSIVLTNQAMSASGMGPHQFPYMIGLSKANLAFAYMGLVIPLLPMMFLVTSWFVGINGVYSSRIFHYVLWSFFLFSLVCVVLELIFTIVILSNCWSFHPIPVELAFINFCK